MVTGSIVPQAMPERDPRIAGASMWTLMVRPAKPRSRRSSVTEIETLTGQTIALAVSARISGLLASWLLEELLRNPARSATWSASSRPT